MSMSRIVSRISCALVFVLVFGRVSATETIVETADFCSIYPFTVSHEALASAQPGQKFVEITNGTGQGNYSWLTWRGENDVKNIVSSLTPPGNSDNYINPHNAGDTKPEIGDWLQGSPGVKNSAEIRDKMDYLLGKDIIIPVWGDMREEGNHGDEPPV